MAGGTAFSERAHDAARNPRRSKGRDDVPAEASESATARTSPEAGDDALNSE